MNKIDTNILLGIGNVSHSEILGGYYQDFTPAKVHYGTASYAKLDQHGIPHFVSNNVAVYNPVLVIQLGIICHDLCIKEIQVEENKKTLLKCMDWLDNNKVDRNDVFWFLVNSDNKQYNLKSGWISGMYQGQAISLYLRAYQLLNNKSYFYTAEKIFDSFKYEDSDGGFKRIDNNGYLWFEEYPSEKPSYVLNGFIYSIFGILDFYRVTESPEAKELWEECVKTLEVNLKKYDVWYWSVYDQLKEQLVSYYYQKNVHIPLMQIMYGLTKNELFNTYAVKWQKNLNNPFHRLITKIMYRVQPRIKKLKK
ncbi:MAG: D-glucuronyl C5-epimerase family protein [Bacteroidales bacterium]|nr:D-glucuronyl C5-epimerase family protein [Bacteroidales bacterium]